MRRIFFRGKRIDNGEWVYGDLRQGYMGTRITEEIDTPPTMSDPCGGAETLYHYVYMDSVGQFTGLHDNTEWEELSEEEQNCFMESYHLREENWKGREIFEGDVIKVKMNDYDRVGIFWTKTLLPDYLNAKIQYDGRRCKFELLFEENKEGLISCDIGWHHEDFEIVGNSHDNPELLKGDKE